jgi:RimJ/RimL family protein N-acetyltransferase
VHNPVLDTERLTLRPMADRAYHFAVAIKESGQPIGECGISSDHDGAMDCTLHKDYRRQGYGTEMGRALLGFAFDTLNHHRVIAHCDTENIGAYKLMEKIGMRREGVFLDARPAHTPLAKPYSSVYAYAMLKDEWETNKEIAYYNALPCTFDGFIEVPELYDGAIRLFCYNKSPANPEKKYVPGYRFAICKDGEQIGQINLRIGYTDGLYYGGQIGYDIDEGHRGNGYAGRACRLITGVAKAHDMKILLITNDYDNNASRRVCEKLGARLLRVVYIPEWHEIYKVKNRPNPQLNVYEWGV